MAAQANLQSQDKDHREDPVIVIQDSLLRERDFGFYEGKPFYARDYSSPKSGKDTHRSQQADDPDFQDVESKESLRRRADAFVHGNLIPILCEERILSKRNVAIFSHAIILNHLWRSILSLFGKNAVSLAPGVYVGNAGSTPLEYLGGWSNTGYLELEIFQSLASSVQEGSTTVDSNSLEKREHPDKAADEKFYPVFPNLKMGILTVNGKDHLRALKRTRGVGSAAHDEGQKKIDKFFKKPEKA